MNFIELIHIEYLCMCCQPLLHLFCVHLKRCIQICNDLQLQQRITEQIMLTHSIHFKQNHFWMDYRFICLGQIVDFQSIQSSNNCWSANTKFFLVSTWSPQIQLTHRLLVWVIYHWNTLKTWLKLIFVSSFYNSIQW